MSGHWEPVMQWVEDDDDDFDKEEYDPQKEQEKEDERLSACICGAYIWSDKQHKMIHVADCCCGNT